MKKEKIMKKSAVFWFKFVSKCFGPGPLSGPKPRPKCLEKNSKQNTALLFTIFLFFVEHSLCDNRVQKLFYHLITKFVF